ncbi:MAG: glycosyltransferase [Clostridium sp.]|uniref:glycosyltransferase n=1 Tax=Clostridium sp. TaxID=1506 RepID=UPI003EE5152C
MKKKILVITSSGSHLGHIARCINIAVELKEKGYDILFGCSEEYLYMPKSKGLKTTIINELSPMQAWNNIKTKDDLIKLAKERMANPEFLKKSIELEKKLIENFRPDLIISDLRNTIGVTSSYYKIPCLSIFNLTVLKSPLNTILPIVIESLINIGVDSYNANKIFGDVIIVPDIAIYEPIKIIDKKILSIISENVSEIYFAGPLVSTKVFESEKNSKAKEILDIVISFGGSKSGEHNLRKVLENISKLKYKINLVIITGPNIKENNIKGYIDKSIEINRLEVIEYTDELIEYMKSSDIAIIHGGHGTINEVICCGVPSIIIPQTKEQSENAKRCLELKVGVEVEPDNIEEELSKAIDFLVNNNIKMHSKLIAKKYLKLVGTKNISKYIEKIIFEYEMFKNK